MVDYEFYVNCYMGNAIPEKAFPAAEAHASAALERLLRTYQVWDSGEESRRLAVCAMAETVYAYSKRRGGVSSASIGGVSVRYDSTDKSLWQELYRQAAIYLDIYRGVSP